MSIPTNPCLTLMHKVDPTILRCIQQASQATSTDFGLLMAQAAQESGFNANAKSATSSASGLFQFVDSTWLDMVRQFGAKYGIGQLAQQIKLDSNGKAVVSDPAVRQEILNLRSNPALSASLAGEYAKLNQDELSQALGRPLHRPDIYMAHFLGAAGATAFLKAVQTKGNTIAADLLPDAAAANRNIFYNASGQPRTVAEIYQSLGAKIDKEASEFGTAATSGPQLASAADPASYAALGISSISPNIDWSGVKLSPQVLDMLNIVALTALKMTAGGSDSAPYAPITAATPQQRHSI